MNISKLNPIGYETKTEKGNTYRKSNLGKSIGTIAMTTGSIAAIKSNNLIVKSLSSSALIDTLEQLAKIKLPAKARPFALGACVVLDALGGLWLGHQVDKYINKKSAKKADALIAEA